MTRVGFGGVQGSYLMQSWWLKLFHIRALGSTVESTSMRLLGIPNCGRTLVAGSHLALCFQYFVSCRSPTISNPLGLSSVYFPELFPGTSCQDLIFLVLTPLGLPVLGPTCPALDPATCIYLGPMPCERRQGGKQTTGGQVFRTACNKWLHRHL